MKRWNKQKRQREATWKQVTGIDPIYYRRAFKWCLDREGKRFYNTLGTSIFYFEDSQDATAFYLTWIDKPKQ